MSENGGAKFDWKQFGMAMNFLFRYGYGGLLLCLMCALINPIKTKEIIEDLGSALGPLIAFAIGGAIHVYYRLLFMDLIVIQCVIQVNSRRDAVANFFRQRKGQPARQTTCKFRYFVDAHHVDRRDCITSFRVVRDTLFEPDQARRFELSHSELHTIYETSFLCVIGFLASWLPAVNRDYMWWFLGVAVVSFLLGLWGDNRLCRRECAYLREIGEEEIKKLLVKCQLAEAAG